MTNPDLPDAEALRAAADQRIREQIHDAANKRAASKAKRAQRAATRTAGLVTRHQTRTTYWTNTSTAATAA